MIIIPHHKVFKGIIPYYCMKKTMITIYPSKELKEQIQSQAYSNRRSMNNFILSIISDHLNFIQPKKEVKEKNGTGQSIKQSEDGITDNGISTDGLPTNGLPSPWTGNRGKPRNIGGIRPEDFTGAY